MSRTMLSFLSCLFHIWSFLGGSSRSKTTRSVTRPFKLSCIIRSRVHEIFFFLLFNLFWCYKSTKCLPDRAEYALAEYPPPWREDAYGRCRASPLRHAYEIHSGRDIGAFLPMHFFGVIIYTGDTYSDVTLTKIQ